MRNVFIIKTDEVDIRPIDDVPLSFIRTLADTVYTLPHESCHEEGCDDCFYNGFFYVFSMT